MAWTYFTASLAEGDILTKAMRDELYDAFLERVAAADMVGDYTVPTELRDCGLITDLVYDVGAGSTVRMATALNAIAPNFIRSEWLTPAAAFPDASLTSDLEYLAFSGSSVGVKTLWEPAKNALGLTSQDVVDILAAPLLDIRQRWNLLREGIRNLSGVRFAFSGSASAYVKSGAWKSGWSAARDDYLANSESPTSNTAAQIFTERLDSWGLGSPPAGSPPYYLVSGFRHAPGFVVPATSAFALYALHGYRQAAGAVSGLTVENAVGVATGSASVVNTGTDSVLEQVVSTNLSSTGTLTLSSKLGAYDDSGELDLLQPPSAGSFGAGTFYRALLGKPVFTHP